MAWLSPRMGVRGVAMARLCCGLITLLMYVPVVGILWTRNKSRLSRLDTSTVWEGS
jgi:hypothetical protein